MKRLWLSLLLWFYNVCPEHGPKTFYCGPGGKGYYLCFKCYAIYREVRKRRIEEIVEEFNVTKS